MKLLGVHIHNVHVTIHVTVAIASPVFHAGSLYSNVKFQFSVNI